MKRKDDEELGLREADPMGFLVEGMTELLKYQLGLTKCDELRAKYGLLGTFAEKAALEEEA